jgi:glycosyltransferase 2 family protein
VTARRISLGLVGLGISAAAVWLAVRGVDLGATFKILSRVSLGPLMIVAVVLVVQLLMRCLRWSQLLPIRPRGLIPVRRLVPVVLVGYLGNAVLPARLGDPLRAVLVGRREAIPASGALGSVVLERAIDTLTLALLIFPAAALSDAPDWLIRAAAVAAALAGAVLIVAQTRLPGFTLSQLRKRVHDPRWAQWLDRADRFVEAMDSAGRRRAVLIAIGLTLLAWLLDGTIYWAAAHSLGIDLPPAGAMLVSAITVLGTAVPSAPGYVGTFELAASTIAVGLGVAPAAALAFAILVHSLTALPLALGGVGALVGMGARFRDLARPPVDGSASIESSTAPAKSTIP